MELYEDAIQAECFTWHWNEVPEERYQLYQLNNNPKSKIRAMQMRGMGLIKGAADMVYFPQCGEIWFIEVKRPGETPREDQRKFADNIIAKGYKYFVVTSLQEFKNLIHGARRRGRGSDEVQY
jgi:hypothetical protein